MLKTIGVGNRLELALLLAIVALVAITPLGNEGTSASILVAHRSLLIFIAIGSIALIKNKTEPEICPVFIGLCLLVLAVMVLSLGLSDGSRFDGFYRWYQHFLFGAAFLAMALMNRERSIHW